MHARARAMTLGKHDIETHEKRGEFVISILGCGRRGLPTAFLFAEAGFRVIGVDTDQRLVDLLKRGKPSFAEAGLDTLVNKHVKEGRVTATKEARKAASLHKAML